jgi:hypothetical protein
MRALKTIENGFREIVARFIGPPRLSRRSAGAEPVLRFLDKRGCRMHPQRAMTTARTRVPALLGLLVIVVILILP